MVDRIGLRTIRDFGEQWSRYRDNSGFYGSLELFEDMIGPLLDPDELKGSRVAEIGSGSGRIVNMLLAAGVSRVIAVEPAIDAFAVLKENTAQHQGTVEHLNILGEKLPSGLGLDFVLSIGVIHHIPDPDRTMRACFEALRPGGRCLIWVYGREGNGAYLGLVLPLRKLSTVLPHWLLSGICHLLNAALGVYILLCRWLPLPLRDYAVKVLGRMSRDKRRLVIYDQLKPTYAKYYTGQEARELMSRAGFSDIRLHHRHGYSWTVVGTRPA